MRLSKHGLVGRGKDCGHYFKTYVKPLHILGGDGVDSTGTELDSCFRKITVVQYG